MLSDPRLELIQQVDISSTRVELSSHPIVLLCGGAIIGSSVCSFRHALKSHVHRSKFEFFLPEEIPNWLDDAMFRNLLVYESDLASICSLIVVIPESPGSIAELGAFSQLLELREKICVINSDELSEEPSFINLGIVRSIKEKDPNRIKIYPWKRLPIVDVSDEVIKDVYLDIQTELDNAPKKQKFNKKKNTHTMALIYELISLFIALKESEIEFYLKNLGLSIKKEELKRKLFLLMRFRIIKKQKYSDSEFYTAIDEKYHRVKFVTKSDSGRFDNLRVSVACRQYYDEMQDENHRRLAIRKMWGMCE